MKHVTLLIVMLAIASAGPAPAQMFQTVSSEQAELLQDGPGRLYCPNCGMHLEKFYKTSHAVNPADGPARQYCSLHCLVETHGEIPAETVVVDAQTLNWIPAATAHYVVGSEAPGTMTMVSKYAFAALADAEAFAAAKGGRVTTFDEAVKVARKGLGKENDSIAEKRAKMAMKGKKIFAKMCAADDLPEFSSIAEAKVHLAATGACGNLDDGQYQAVAIYLMTRGTAEPMPSGAIIVPEDAKCPVCGMFVAKYPQWAAMARDKAGAPYYFDGVKDMMKFLFDPARYHVATAGEDFVELSVTNYYTLNAIDAKSAFFVVGSSIYGPMGKELIPFATEKDAAVFLADHAGAQVLSFDAITPEIVGGLDR